MNYVVNEKIRKSILAFMDRVTVKGIEENKLYMEVLVALSTSIEDNAIPKPE